MTGSFEELRAGLLLVGDQLGSAGQYAHRAAALIDDALARLTALSEQHSESLVPAELAHAAEELGRGIELIHGGTAAVAEIEARL